MITRLAIENLLRAANKLSSMVIIGHENELQGAWPTNGQQHKCGSCYDAAKELREAIAELEGRFTAGVR